MPVEELDDPRRVHPPHVADERRMLETWLDFHWTDDNGDADLDPLDDADWETDLATWEQACERSRAAAAPRSLDDTGGRRGTEVSLRWIYVHMIEEYARHNGHADLIRELIDGAVGD
ncbi:MAG TPA: DUF664 domain-containing protein [Acidimicrobiales bacterium]|nr:DUF664 domain-containing protein [Acidimicrobiales bacterium]